MLKKSLGRKKKKKPKSKDVFLFNCLQFKKLPLIGIFKALNMPFLFLPRICLGYACLELTALGVRLDDFQNQSSHSQYEVDLHWPSNPWDVHMVACEEH